MAETFYNGEIQLLYLVISGTEYPIGCLTENSFSETVEMMDTTTIDNAGWKTSRPLNQSYNISFSGIQINSNDGISTKYSYDKIKGLKRARTKIVWSIKTTDGTFSSSGSGYFKDLSETAPGEGLLTFTGTIIGYGQPTDSFNFLFEDGDNFVFMDGDNFITK